MIEGITATLPSFVSQESSRPLARPRNPAGNVDSSVQVGAQQPARANSSAAASAPVPPETVKQLAAEVSGLDGDFSISVDEDSGMIIVRITDAVTGEIVKQIPPKELLEADRSMERIVGLLVDDQV